MSQCSSHEHHYLICAIFRNPISGNTRWCEIESLLHLLGASVQAIQRHRFAYRQTAPKAS